MNNVIKILESMGSNLQFSNLIALGSLLTDIKVNSEQSKAIMTKDVSSLEKQLDICPDIYCLLFPAEDGEEEKESDTEQENTEQENTEKNSVING